MKMLTMAAVVLAVGATSGVASAQARAFRAERPDVGAAQAARAERAAAQVQPRFEAVRVRAEVDRSVERAIVRAQAAGQRERVVAPAREPGSARAHGVIEYRARGDGTSTAAPAESPRAVPGATQVPQRVRCAEGQPSCGAMSREGVLPAPVSAASAAANEEQLRAIIKRVREAIADKVSRYVQPDPEA